MQNFLIAGGSVPGTEHTKPGQPGWTNNQDSFAIRDGGDYLVAVVCDGCSSTPHSEVGAKIASRLISGLIAEDIDARTFLPWSNRIKVSIAYAQNRTKETIKSFARAMSVMPDEDYELALSDYFLFTIMGVVVSPEETIVFSLGDGVYSINGEVTVIEQFQDNAPPYLAYACMPSIRYPGNLDLLVRASVPTSEVESVLIGSDGLVDLINAESKALPGREELLGELSQFWSDPKFVHNSDAIRRRLAIANCERVVDGHISKGLLPDDTTLVVVRRDNKREETNA